MDTTSQNTSSGSSSDTVYKGIFGAAASIINNTVSNLFKNKVYKAQADNIKMDTYLNALTQDEQYVLATKLQEAQTDTERMKILTDAVTQIQIQQMQAAANGNLKMAAVFVAAGFVVVIAAFLIKKSLQK